MEQQRGTDTEGNVTVLIREHFVQREASVHSNQSEFISVSTMDPINDGETLQANVDSRRRVSPERQSITSALRLR